MEKSQIISKERVSKHGEVFTNIREINAMLDLVNHETKRIESRFLEPACGNGNFLIEVLKRKVEVIKKKFSKSQINFERNLFLAVASLYGIDIQNDNVIKCQERLLDYIVDIYGKIFKKKIKKEFIESIKFILSRNILCGDALSLTTHELNSFGSPIVFSDWTIVQGNSVKRKDYIFSDLVDRLGDSNENLFSDLTKEKKVFIPKPIKDYPLVDFLEIKNEFTN